MKGFTLIELLVVIVIIALLAALSVPFITIALCQGKAGATAHLIDQLTQAAKAYELDNNAYPPGDGTGSATLAAALQASGPRGYPYFWLQPDALTPAGDIRSLVRWNTDILHYKNHAVNWPGNLADATAHNKSSFDIWCRDCRGVVDGLNNWGQ